MKALKIVFRLNAISCLFFGLLFSIFPAPVGQFIGTDLHTLVTILGVGLVLNGLHLWYASNRKNVLMFEVYWFSLGDISWFIATFLLIGADFFITSYVGIWVGIIVAIMVITLGLAQLYIYADLNKLGVQGDDMLPPDLNRLDAIEKSWSSMRPSVKIWLFALNGIFALAYFFWPADFAIYILISFTISGAFLLPIMTLQRGLTRLLGIAHLIPWVPLWVYLVNYIMGDIGFYEFAYLLVFVAMLSICLVLDVIDVYRWFKGETYRLGSKNAV